MSNIQLEQPRKSTEGNFLKDRANYGSLTVFFFFLSYAFLFPVVSLHMEHSLYFLGMWQSFIPANINTTPRTYKRFLLLCLRNDYIFICFSSWRLYRGTIFKSLVFNMQVQWNKAILWPVWASSRRRGQGEGRARGCCHALCCTFHHCLAHMPFFWEFI